MGVVELTPPQIALAASELALLVAGGYLLTTHLGPREKRESFLEANGLPKWSLTGVEVILLVLMIFVFGTAGQTLAARLLSPHVHASPDKAGLEIAVYGLAFHGLALLGWPVFFLIRGHLFADYGTAPDPVEPPTPVSRPRLSWGEVFRQAAMTLAMALPIVAAVSFLWNNVLHLLHLPTEPQDLLAIFGDGHSRLVFAGMLAVACVVAPVNEELLFRGAIYRAIRQRYGRIVGLIFSGVFFGAIHGNWSGALPLAVFGAALALAYERTGDIRVNIVIHGLFNLNTILVLVSGLPQ